MDKKQTFKDRFSNKKSGICDFCAIAKCCYINNLTLFITDVFEYNCSELTQKENRFPDRFPFLGVFHGILSRF